MLDQYFLVNSAAIERLGRYAELNDKDTVLEIGPGLGFITEMLAKTCQKVIAVEKDVKLKPVLTGEFSAYPNVEFVFNDFLFTDISGFNKIVSNIPYSASAPILFKLLRHDFSCAVLFFQKEFGEKMLSKPGTKEYGRLSVMVQHYFDIEMKEVLNRVNFYPQPKMDSCIVVLKKKTGVAQDKRFDDFVREIFRYKNKSVRNAYKLAFGKEISDERKVDSLTGADIESLFAQSAAI
ncbi:MAG: 16S rRNA (adenine(1518)-N(6)/adenine(1519)-N(6))-dimethyltransferase RsmA [Candidatus Micrarchaeota archaeon]